ncbi:MAG: N-acetyltransferase [Alphaproteobacteria bacterium]|jgi:phosphinothricin acetyltransferase|nr:N-acetyltransferase [Alphaproteobacteria bacterium]
MLIRDAHEDDLPAILAIHNDAVLTTTAIWNSTAVDLEDRRAWLAARRQAGYPVLVAEQAGEVAGYASFGDWRAWEGYRFTVENSIYIRADRRGRGIGSALLAPLVAAAGRLGKHVMVAGIEAGNAASIRLHHRHGFVQVGHFREVGEKFGRWLDLVFLQRTLAR